MIREAYKVVEDAQGARIIKVEITDQEGVSWRVAKKTLRQLYLQRAKALRSLSKDKYFTIPF